MSLQFAATLTPIYRGGATTRTSRWVAADYIDRILLATRSAPALFWPAAGMARPIPGLPDSNGWEGVEVFDSKVLLWRDATLKWSATNDFAQWIPVALTAASGRATLESPFLMTPTGVTTGQAFLKDVAGGAVVGQFIRIVSYENDPTQVKYDYFKVATVAASTFLNALSIKRPQAVAPGQTTRIYLGRYSAYADWSLGARLKIGGASTQLIVTNRSRNKAGAYLTDGQSTAIPAIGSTMTLSMRNLPSEWQQGDVVSVGSSDEPGLDLYEVVAPPASLLSVKRLALGDRVVGTVWADGTYVGFQNWVEVRNDGLLAINVPAETAVSVVDSVSLVSLGYTGGTDAGTLIPVGSVVETVDTNDSGELENVGGKINGPIFAVVTLGEYAHILKEKSIQSIQAVGQASGTFFLRPEILDEGPLGRYAWCRFNDAQIAFFGNKNLYVYGGGINIKALAIPHWDALMLELDRARVDEVVAYHNRQQNEVWFSYPTLVGTTKVIVYNYLDGSIVTDLYPNTLNGITALGRIDWELAPTWESLDATELCNGTSKRWYEYVDVGEREYTLIGIGGDLGNPDLGELPTATVPRILVHGRAWWRATRDECLPDPYECIAETPDFDFGQPEHFKYVDTVEVTLAKPDGAFPSQWLEVYVGVKDTLDGDIRWSAPARMSLDGLGKGAFPRVNITAAGRYARVRFRSYGLGAQWQISSYRIVARLGGTF